LSVATPGTTSSGLKSKKKYPKDYGFSLLNSFPVTNTREEYLAAERAIMDRKKRLPPATTWTSVRCRERVVFSVHDSTGLERLSRPLFEFWVILTSFHQTKNSNELLEYCTNLKVSSKEMHERFDYLL